MSLPLPEQRTCPEGHTYTAFTVGRATTVCPACAAGPEYAEAISRLAGRSFTEAEYLETMRSWSAPQHDS